jgi:hypothetical protein
VEDILRKLHMDVILPSTNRVYEVMQIEGGKIRDFILANVLPKLAWPSPDFVRSLWQCYEENGGAVESKNAMFAAAAQEAWNESRGEPERENPAEKIYYAYNNLEYFLGTFALVRKRTLSATWLEPSVGLIVREKAGNISGMLLTQEGFFVTFESKEMPHVLDYYEPIRDDDGASWFRNYEKLQMALRKAFNCTRTLGLDKFRADMVTVANHMAAQV